MHIFIPNLGGVVSQPREYLIWLGMGMVILLGTLKVIKDGILRESSFKVYILLFSALLLSSSIFNPIKNMDMFVINSIRLLGGIILWFALMQFDLSAKERLSILSLIFISAVIESVIGVMQFFGLYRYIPITPAPEIGMVGGAFQQKNLFASWIATGLIISLYLITTYRFKNHPSPTPLPPGPRSQAIFRIAGLAAKRGGQGEGAKGWMKIIFFAGVALLSLSLIIAGSRTGLLGIALGMLIILPLRARHYFAVRKNLIIWFMAFFIGIGGGYYLLSIKDRLDIKKLTVKQIEWFHPSAIAPRMLMWRVSLEMFKERPIFGQGFANFGSLYMYHQAEVVKSNPKYKELLVDSYTNHPHNEILLIISEAGMLGILSILVLLVWVIKAMRRYGKERAGLYLGLLTPIVIHILLEFPLKLSVAHYLLFVILVYMATSHFLKVTPLKAIPSSGKGRVGGILKGGDFRMKMIILVFFGIFMVFAIYTIMTFHAYNQLVRWHVDYEANGRGSEGDILPATRNLYLRNWARPMYMFAKAKESIEDVEKNRDFLENFLRWSSLEKQRQPLMHVFSYDANVLLSMGIHYKEHVYFDEAMKTVEEGLSLYPNSEDLKALRQRIASEFFRIIFHSFQKRG